jgi:D-alanyl-D-alanine carboxypeptidase
MQQRIYRFVLRFTLLFIFVIALVVPSCRFGESRTHDEAPDSRLSLKALHAPMRDTVEQAFRTLMDDPSLKGATLGYMVLDCTDGTPDVVAQHEPGVAMIPASTLKLFVTAAALEIIGQPVFSEVEMINQFSINWRASKLLRRVGGEIYGKMTNSNGFRAIMEFWSEKGLDLHGFHFDDGNGLSRNNQVSPKQLTDLLYIMRFSNYFDIFYSSLPIAGYSGTMKKMLAGTPGEGRVRAKTGTIAGVKSLAGYVSTISGRNLIFAIIINNYTCQKKVMRKKLEQVMLRMTEV